MTEKLDNLEKLALKNAFIVAALPQLLKLGLSAAQASDIADRAVASGKIFPTSTGGVDGWSPSMIIGDLRDDPKNKHLFTTGDDETPSPSNDLGIPKADLDKMSARKKLELANHQAFIDAAKRKART